MLTRKPRQIVVARFRSSSGPLAPAVSPVCSPMLSIGRRRRSRLLPAEGEALPKDPADMLPLRFGRSWALELWTFVVYAYSESCRGRDAYETGGCSYSKI